MEKEKALFICEHNSARSLMAEAFLLKLAGDRFEVESAGLNPTEVNPLAIEVMKEVGLDISHKTPQSVFKLYQDGKIFSHVITVCDEAAALCPLFPGLTKRHHWPFDDPALFTGTVEEKMALTRVVRDQIETRIKEWLAQSDDPAARSGGDVPA